MYVCVCAHTEERYTWLVDPEELGGNVGEFYLVLRPVVGPGIKSVDATVDISVFTSSCQFWDKTHLEWSTRGCRVSVAMVTSGKAGGDASITLCLSLNETT